MVSVQQYLISGRFLTTMGHLIALLLLFSTIENNIQVSMGESYSSASYTEAKNESWVMILSAVFLYLAILIITSICL
jgi:hypothetical protein